MRFNVSNLIYLLIILMGVACLRYMLFQINYAKYSTIGDKTVLEGDKEGALNYYEKALHYCPDDVRLVLLYGDLLASLGKVDERIDYFQKESAIRFSPDIEFRLGIHYYSTGHYDPAVYYFERLHYLSPSKFRPLYYLAKIYRSQGDLSRSDSLATLLIQKEPKINSAEILLIKEEMKALLRR